MTADEVQKYINEVAFSGAEEFLEKYKDSKRPGIIGHFGLGFYSAFMVAKKVEIITKSYTDAPAAHWTCDGSRSLPWRRPIKKSGVRRSFFTLPMTLPSSSKKIKIRELLVKYNKFMPVPIKFGTRTETLPKPEDAKEEDPAPTKEVDNIINNTEPAWPSSPLTLPMRTIKISTGNYNPCSSKSLCFTFT